MFRYSSLAKGENLDGETNVFRFLELNASQKIDVFYLVGTDHFYRYNPTTGRKDTLQKIEDNISRRIYGFNPFMHSVSLVFINRGSTITTDRERHLSIGFLPRLKFEASSTQIRAAFTGDKKDAWLATLPFSLYEYIETYRLYRPSSSMLAPVVLPQKSGWL